MYNEHHWNQQKCPSCKGAPIIITEVTLYCKL